MTTQSPPGSAAAKEQLLEYRVRLLMRLEQQPAEFAQAVAAIPEADWWRRIDATGRHIHKIAAHVRDLERLALLPRTLRVLDERDPVLEPYPSHYWSEAGYRADEPMEAILADWSEVRAGLLHRLHGQSDAIWSRMGFHPPSGSRTLQWWVERIYNHVQSHLDDIRRLTPAPE